MCPPMFNNIKKQAQLAGDRVRDAFGIPDGVSIKPKRWKVPGDGGRNDHYGVMATIKL